MVFHGGSGSEPDKIAAAISYGVFKMNIDTDTPVRLRPGDRRLRLSPTRPPSRHQIDPATGRPTKKHYDPRAWLRAGEQGLAARLAEAFDTLGSTGRTLAG